MPEHKRFGPIEPPGDAESAINMAVDEYETIRLIDLEGFTQEECASQMHIARTTVQGIYSEARKKSPKLWLMRTLERTQMFFSGEFM